MLIRAIAWLGYGVVSLILLITTACSSTTFRNYKIIRVIDGDTVVIDASYLPPELGNSLKLRIYGIDTPEKGHLAKCNAERELSDKATKFVIDEINKANEISIELRKWDKFGGRVLGDVILDGKRLSDILIANGMAKPYHGEKKTGNWCN